MVKIISAAPQLTEEDAVMAIGDSEELRKKHHKKGGGKKKKHHKK